MNEKEEEKKEVVSQGRQLMKVSSEIRASDIEQKILRLEDKWAHLVSVMDFRYKKCRMIACFKLQRNLDTLYFCKFHVYENHMKLSLFIRSFGFSE